MHSSLWPFNSISFTKMEKGKQGTTIIGIAGYSNSGKTTLIERLIPLLVRHGLRIGTVKHHGESSPFDTPGKDTYRHRQAGALITVGISPVEMAVFENVTKEEPLIETISRYMHDIDICIVEGFKSENIPKIEIVTGGNDMPPRYTHDRWVIAVISKEQLSCPMPLFSPDNPGAIADFIVSFADEKSRQDE